jgi:NAD(P)-dependent dehydrogenase (short-subunit alcohol dehydrogenase family)
MVCSVLSLAALKAKYVASQKVYSTALSAGRTAVVVGATSGIGEACAYRLARQGFVVIAVGRDREGRKEAMIEALTEASRESLKEHEASASTSTSSNLPAHEFRACDAFSLKNVKEVAQEIVKDHPKIDALILSQGMATTQGFTPTADEGNDEKLTLHYWSRMALIQELLPSLQKSTMKGGAVVLSVLSGGVHSPYKDFQKDPELKNNYGVSNAANIAGYYNDLGMDAFARQSDNINANVNFVHACPGFVNTNWGTEMPWMLRKAIRLLQPFGRSPAECAEYLMSPTVLASEAGDPLPAKPAQAGDGDGDVGVIIMGENGQTKSLTNKHSEEERNACWNITKDVLGRAGIKFE